MAGVQNQIGIGSAQVLDSGPSYMPLVQQLYRNKQYKEEKERYDQETKKRDEKDLYDLIGSNLNLKDFNPVIHERVKQAQVDLAQKIKAGNQSYADAYILAQNKAGELTQLSQGLNKLDQQIALTKKEYEGDKRINAGNIELIARKKILDQLNSNGTVDPNINYFDEALNEYPEFALTDKSDYTVTDFIPEEQQNLSGKYKDINSAGRTDQYDWKVDKLSPAYYDFKDNGEAKEPTIKTRTQPSGLKDESGLDIPMLSDEAYGRFRAKPSNLVALNLRLRNKYGKDLDLKSSEAETLRKIEAFKDVDRQKPRVNKTIVEKEAPQRSHSFYFGSGFGQGGANGQTQGNAFDDMPDKDYGNFRIKDGAFYNKDGTPKSGEIFISGEFIPSSIKTALNAGGIKPEFLIKGVDAVVKDGVIQTISNKLIGTVTRDAMEGVYQRKTDTEPLKGTPLKFAGKDKPQQQSKGKPKTVKQNGVTYTLNEKTGKYE
jgi:hypothetical protein